MLEMAGSAEVGQGEQLHAQEKGERSFTAKPYWQKLLIIAGGILFNIILVRLRCFKLLVQPRGSLYWQLV